MRADFLSGPPQSKTQSLRSGYFSNKLDDYQRHAVQFALEVRTCGMFAEQGTGKTWVSLALVEQIASSDFAGLLIVMKNNKETTWQDQAVNLRGVEVTGDWDEFKRIKRAKLLIIHYEQATAIIDKLVRYGERWSCIIIDECQRLKNRGSRSSRMASRLRRFGRYRLGLSGTPLEQAPQDVWAQMRFINWSVFGDEWKPFEKRYLKRTGYMGYKRVFNEKRRAEFIKRLSEYCIRIEKDVLKLKPLTHELHKLEMDDAQWDAYRDMKTRSAVRLPTGEWHRAPLKMVRNNCLSQLTGGFIQTDGGYYWVGTPKLRRVIGLLSTVPKPVVVFCRFLPEMIELEQRLTRRRYRVATYAGRTKDKPGTQRAFQAGDIDVLICQERAGGVGLDLYAARSLIIYSCSWSSIAFDQLIARVHRRGQTHPITAHHLIVKNSIDVRKHKRINSKLSTNEQTLKQLRRNDMGEFAIADLAKALGTDAAGARARLRSAEIEKTDGRYAWPNQKAFDAVVKQLKGKGGDKVEAKSEKSDKKVDKKSKGAAPENKADKKNGKKADKKSKK